MTRYLAAAVLAIHGCIHAIGFVVPWRLAAVEGFPYRTTALDGAVTLGETGAMAVGVAWLVIGIGFLAAAVGLLRRARWALPITAVLAIASTCACLLGLPETAAGIVVNAGILAGVAVVGYRDRAATRPGSTRARAEAA